MGVNPAPLPLSRKYLVSFPPAALACPPVKVRPMGCCVNTKVPNGIFSSFGFPPGGAKREMGEMDSGMAHYGIS